MKTLVAFASKSGTAQEVAQRISESLPNAVLADLSNEKPSLEGFEAAIVGGGVRIGSVHKAAKRFIDANAAELANMHCAFFITNSFPETTDEILGKMLPEALRSKAVFAGSLGGRMDVDKLSGLDKTIAKMVSKAIEDEKPISNTLDEAAIEQLISKFVEL